MTSATTYRGMEGIATKVNGHVSPISILCGFGSASSVKLHYEVCHTIPTCIDVCGAIVIYVHSITFGRLGICGTHLKSSIQDIVDEVTPIKKRPPYGVEGRFIRM